ncbi:hypothetical protein GOP47_0010078 [Adiantum capillus-veneris]|uniref:Transmembrane protein n=1 Tax=Adiantum capillus-veneris TaxID=13818 RepID=A0A9D4UUG6_ADICA|nr:hypothetical protein GOP47_0010078 [Adiantum capillus-veneris]
MENAAWRMVLMTAVLAVLLGAAAEGQCTVRNDSDQSLVIVPTAKSSASVTYNVDSSVVLNGPQQHCYFRNPHTGHQKGPVMLANGRTYAIVDSQVQGEVNVCVTSFLGGLLSYGAVISAGIYPLGDVPQSKTLMRPL